MRDLPHLASLIFNRPLLYRGDIGTGIIDAIGPRILNGERMDRTEVVAELQRPAREARAPGGTRRLAGGAYMPIDGIAVLPIVGSLVRRGSWLDAECGMMSYGLIRDASTEILMDGSVNGLLLEFDSGGGEANGCFDCADDIRNIAAAVGKPIWAHANEIMCSAAYALGSSGSKIWVARTAEVGSIGVLGAHVDRSGADKMAGVKWTYVFAGDHKTDGNPHEPLGEDTLARMQADVDNLMTMFVDHVSQNRGMTAEEIRATKAEIFRGTLAVDAGLADEVGTLDEALMAFAEHVDEMQTSGPSARMSASQMRTELMSTNRGKPGANVNASKPEGEDEDKKKVVAPSEDEDEGGEKKPKAKAEDEEDGEGKKSTAAAAGPDAIKAETERCAALSALVPRAASLGVNFDLTAAISGKLSVEAAKAKIMDAAASGDAPETSAIAAPKQKAGGKQAHTAEDKRGMWKKAFKGR